MMRISLIGNPNSGKTTLFNALTGEQQRVGNWPGVTVEQKTGEFQLGEDWVSLTDLPGIYSLTVSSEASLDERIAQESVLAGDADQLIQVIDACHLERHLFLTSQLLELGKPLILALNMSDLAAARGIKIDTEALSQALSCKVVTIQANKKKGLAALQQALKASPALPRPLPLDLPAALQDWVQALSQQWRASNDSANRSQFLALRCLEGDLQLQHQAECYGDLPQDSDILLADARYRAIHQLVSTVQYRESLASESLTAKIDQWVLHRFWALPIFLLMMYSLFFFAIRFAGLWQDCFELASEAIFVKGLAKLLQFFKIPAAMTNIAAQGLGVGITTTLSFIPVLAGMYFFLALLEASGYMARAAFVVDRLMRFLGLPGKSFVPMIVGFGCNVPAIMAARTLDSERDRFITVLMTPFMSCSARLTIYAVFVAAFFPNSGQNVLFSLYLFGIGAAVFTGLVLRKTLLQGHPSPLIIELPTYHRPCFAELWREMVKRLNYFILRAGKLIIPVCTLLAVANQLYLGSEGQATSVLAYLGHAFTPLFAPMGISPENWPATVGLLTGTMAKEVVIGTLNSLYTQSAALIPSPEQNFELWLSLKAAFLSIPENISALLHPFAKLKQAAAAEPALYGLISDYFASPVAAYAYLLFVLLYIPCLSTMAAIRHEATRALMLFSILWSLVLAYSVSVIFYQLATLAQHPQQSLTYAFAAVWLLLVFVALLYALSSGSRRGDATANL